jgi:hypothetical protein
LRVVHTALGKHGHLAVKDDQQVVDFPLRDPDHGLPVGVGHVRPLCCVLAELFTDGERGYLPAALLANYAGSSLSGKNLRIFVRT